MFEELTKYGQRCLLMPVGRQAARHSKDGRERAKRHIHTLWKNGRACNLRDPVAFCCLFPDDVTSIRDY
jgi:hypothetical protein